MYYHATQERAEVTNRVQYTTWIKSEGETRKFCVLKQMKFLIFKGRLNGYISEVLVISLAVVTFTITM